MCDQSWAHSSQLGGEESWGVNLRLPDSQHCPKPFLLLVAGIMNEYATNSYCFFSAYLHVKHC